MTILDVINKTAPFLGKHGIDSPRLTIELLLAHLLRKRRLDLYLEFERVLPEPTLAQLREMVRRRLAGEPLQYITGETEFCGLRFAVDRRVLIPRPETELLVTTALGRMANRASPVLADICTGSGCVAVSLAAKSPVAQVWATDVSADAIAVAEGNAKRHQVEKKIRFSVSDLLTGLPNSLTVDAMVSNPPYIASGDWAKLPKEVRDFEPVQALVAGEDGLKFHRRILNDARRFLLPDGFLCLELGAGQRPAVEQLCASRGYRLDQVVKDLQGHERVVVVLP